MHPSPGFFSKSRIEPLRVGGNTMPNERLRR